MKPCFYDMDDMQNGRFVLVLDIDRVFSGDGSLLAQTAGTKQAD